MPNDNSCLFYALAYLCEGAAPSKGIETRLRGLIAAKVLADPDPETKALLLGMNSVYEYSEWIKNHHHWGGENEIIVLAEYYNVEVCVISCETQGTLVYGRCTSAVARVYILYTGQHYDPLVGADSPSTPEAEEIKRFTIGGSAELDSAALLIAEEHAVEAAKRAKQRRVKRIKCGGCDAVLADAAAFQSHCGEYEHDDDFCYDCSEVEVVVEEDEELPEGAIDLTDEAKYYTFYNSASYSFSNYYPTTIEMNGKTYKTVEHYWQAAKYLTTAPELAAKIAAASTVAEAQALSHTEGSDQQRKDWDTGRYNILVEILKAKFHQHEALAKELVGTGGLTIVNIDTDPWAGMIAPGGIATGQNNVGKALMEVRADLVAAVEAS